MSLQLRPQGGGRAYSPNRDIAWLFPQAMRIALNAMAETDWESWFGDYLRHTNTTEEDLAKVATAFGNFCKATIEKTDLKTPAEVLNEAGFFNTPGPAQMAIAAKLGQVITGVYFAGIRDAMHQDDTAPADVLDLVKQGEAVAELFRTHKTPVTDSKSG